MSDVLAFSVAVAYDSGSPVRRLHRLASSRQEVLDPARSLNGDIDLATVVYEVVGPGYKKWIREKVPAMDDPAPIDCLHASALTKRLRTTLMRFPSQTR
ncbi:hypothetical protein GWK53_00765 [Burkholderia cepacia]|uniref:hypothetical protein n=1 Tax=Burkholderia cepacia TaxID=292 RepID=UPI0013F43D9F|nr:hypothetical protein [Burkholderia cepacia]NHB05042.1 hypothetical protein [Burkholderia cepacia]